MRDSVFVVMYQDMLLDEEHRNHIVIFNSEDGALDFKRYLECKEDDAIQDISIESYSVYGNLYDYMLG